MLLNKLKSNKGLFIEIPLGWSLSKMNEMNDIPDWLQGLILSQFISINRNGSLEMRVDNYSIEAPFSHLDKEILNKVLVKLSGVTILDIDAFLFKEGSSLLKGKYDSRANKTKTPLIFTTKENCIDPNIFFKVHSELNDTRTAFFLPDNIIYSRTMLKYWVLGCARVSHYDHEGIPTGIFLPTNNIKGKNCHNTLKESFKRKFDIDIKFRRFNKRIDRFAINQQGDNFKKLCHLILPSPVRTDEIGCLALQQNIYFKRLYYQNSGTKAIVRKRDNLISAKLIKEIIYNSKRFNLTSKEIIRHLQNLV